MCMNSISFIILVVLIASWFVLDKQRIVLCIYDFPDIAARDIILLWPSLNLLRYDFPDIAAHDIILL